MIGMIYIKIKCEKDVKSTKKDTRVKGVKWESKKAKKKRGEKMFFIRLNCHWKIYCSRREKEKFYYILKLYKFILYNLSQ